MKAKFTKCLHFVLGLFLIGAVGYGSWFLVCEFFRAINAASPEISAAIIGAMATVLVGISVILISQAHERKRAQEEAHRLKKVEIYQAFIDMVSRMIGASNEKLKLKEPEQDELLSFLFKFKSDLLLWGAPKVIKAQIEFESVSGNGNTLKIFKAVDTLYLAIREDIGLSNSGLKRLELVKLYLNSEARKDIEP